MPREVEQAHAAIANPLAKSPDRLGHLPLRSILESHHSEPGTLQRLGHVARIVDGLVAGGIAARRVPDDERNALVPTSGRARLSGGSESDKQQPWRERAQ